jgi:hypothetical protein
MAESSEAELVGAFETGIIVMGKPGRGKSRMISHILNTLSKKDNGGKNIYALWDNGPELLSKYNVKGTNLITKAEDGPLGGHTQVPAVYAESGTILIDTPGYEDESDYEETAMAIKQEVLKLCKAGCPSIKFIFVLKCNNKADGFTMVDLMCLGEVLKMLDPKERGLILKSMVVVLNTSMSKKASRFWGMFKAVFQSVYSFNSAKQKLIVDSLERQIGAVPGSLLLLTRFEDDPYGGLGSQWFIQSMVSGHVSLIEEINKLQPYKASDFQFDFNLKGLQNANEFEESDNDSDSDS